jgi:hypothetical protein
VTPVNLPPTLSNVSPPAVNEDALHTFAVSQFSPGFNDPNGDAIATVRITSLPTNGVLKLSNINVTLNQDIAAAQLGNLTYTPNQHYNGSDSFGWNASDGQLFASSPASVNLTISAVNDAPTLNAISNPAAIPEDSGPQMVNLSGISAGPPNESAQTLTVTAASNNTALIPNPSVTYTNPNATGSLAYTPVANAFGSAVITVAVMDNGGTANAGIDVVTRQFTVTVNPDPERVKSGLNIQKNAGGGYRIDFIGNPGQQYTVQYVGFLPPQSGDWQLHSFQVADANGMFFIIDNPPASLTKRFYRAIVP